MNILKVNLILKDNKVALLFSTYLHLNWEPSNYFFRNYLTKFSKHLKTMQFLLCKGFWLQASWQKQLTQIAKQPAKATYYLPLLENN